MAENPTESAEENIKPLLDFSEQIECLKAKGISFDLCSEEEAMDYLANRTFFFKLTAFRVLFKKRVGGERDGQYVGLDFRHLLDLASLDRDLRYTILPLTLDVEHAATTKIMRIASWRENRDSYAVSRDYMASLNHKERNRRKGDLSSLKMDGFAGDLIKKFGTDPAKIPLWANLELFSFGGLNDVYLYCSGRWNDEEMKHEHYMLRQAQSIRNACAHSSNMLNKLARTDSSVETEAAVQQALAKAGFSHRVRTARMKCPCVQQIVTLMYTHTKMVANGSGKRIAAANMRWLRGRIAEVVDVVPLDNSARASLNFLMILIDKWFA